MKSINGDMATGRKKTGRMVLVYLTIVAVLAAISCTRGSLAEQYIEPDRKIYTEIQHITKLADSLAINTHPNPVRYIQEIADGAGESGLQASFKKYSALGYYYYEHIKDYPTAEAFTDSTLALFEQENITRAENKLYYLNAILQKSDVLREQGFFGASVQQLLAGWQLLEPVLSPCLAYKYSSRLGTFSYEQKNYLESIQYYSQAWKISDGCYVEKNAEYFVRKFQFLQNVASNYMRLDMPYSALYYHEQSLASLDDIAAMPEIGKNMAHFIVLARAVAYGNKADVLQKTGQGHIAEKLWEESIQINMQPGFANEHAQFKKLHMAEYYISEKKMARAEQLLGEVEEWNRNVESRLVTRNWHYVYWKWQAETGTTEQAYQAYQAYIALTEQENNARFELAATDLDMQVDYLAKNLQIRELENNQTIQNIYLGFLIPLSLFVLISLLVVWKNRAITRKNLHQIDKINKKINKKNEQLHQKNAAIAKITSIVSHDLRSPLAGVKEVSAIMLEDEKLAPKYKTWGEMIHAAARQFLGLTSQILNFELKDGSEDAG